MSTKLRFCPKLHFALFFFIFLFLCKSGFTAPFIPANEAMVLEQLSFRANDPTARELHGLRDVLSSDPRNLDKAIILARRYYQLALAEGDPRFIGYAQAALSSWWSLAEPPVPVLVLRATLRQYNHDFINALSDLDQAIRREPQNGAAWAQRAAIYMVQADYAAAREDCGNLRGVASELIVLACTAAADNLNGQAEKAYNTLRQAYEFNATRVAAEEKLWILTRLAEMADRLGRSREADAYFKVALALNIPDVYLLAVYAEFLLDENRHREVVDLLKGKERSDVLLVRLALAEKTLALPQAQAHAAAIRARFDAARLRDDKLHIQDEARFYLYFRNDPREALRLAQENWQTQREPSDARMLLEAALAAKDVAAAQPVLAWLTRLRTEDRHLQKLAVKIGELKP